MNEGPATSIAGPFFRPVVKGFGSWAGPRSLRSRLNIAEHATQACGRSATTRARTDQTVRATRRADAGLLVRSGLELRAEVAEEAVIDGRRNIGHGRRRHLVRGESVEQCDGFRPLPQQRVEVLVGPAQIGLTHRAQPREHDGFDRLRPTRYRLARHGFPRRPPPERPAASPERAGGSPGSDVSRSRMRSSRRRSARSSSSWRRSTSSSGASGSSWISSSGVGMYRLLPQAGQRERRPAASRGARMSLPQLLQWSSMLKRAPRGENKALIHCTPAALTAGRKTSHRRAHKIAPACLTDIRRAYNRSLLSPPKSTGSVEGLVLFFCADPVAFPSTDSLASSASLRLPPAAECQRYKTGDLPLSRQFVGRHGGRPLQTQAALLS
jgi:hypothetical protein